MLDLDARVCNAFGYGTSGDGPTCNGLVNEMLAELRKLREENRWIPVTERLPDKESYVHAATANDLFVTWWSRDGFCGVTAAVTHWRPLPKPPEVGK